MWFATVKRFFDTEHPAYTVKNLKKFVVAKMITVEQYKEITDSEYVV
ncbi:XkdX family protein [Paenibacillus alvei]|uniref:XkdX family protein n=1 Tax=Paenibacillus alvei TaxID=44250 RepID=A0ABT4GW54_PAEAL|nr:XkdX family protein [Paenibacillus alvei]MCY9760937.1 XkdX family protein [Paenibacillus alvei]MCY9768857.1 XkdX family protein [Paenibacillus alvei]